MYVRALPDWGFKYLFCPRLPTKHSLGQAQNSSISPLQNIVVAHQLVNQYSSREVKGAALIYTSKEELIRGIYHFLKCVFRCFFLQNRDWLYFFHTPSTSLVSCFTVIPTSHTLWKPTHFCPSGHRFPDALYCARWAVRLYSGSLPFEFSHAQDHNAHWIALKPTVHEY